MKRWRWVSAWALAAPAFAAPAAPPVTIVVTRQADGSWTADYRFRERAGAWMFPRSNPDLDGRPWRQRSWTVETRGVRLERLGRYDALVAEGRMPARVRIRFVPLSQPLRADYSPALRFSDGSLALYTGHFRVVPQPSVEAVARFGFDLPGSAERSTTIEVHARGQRLLVRGAVMRGGAVRSRGNPATYVYAGNLPLMQTPALTGIVDPGLPSWVSAELHGFLPRLLAYYTARLGKPAGGRPVAMVSWGGAAREGLSLSGSVLDAMVVMDVAGRRVSEPSRLVLDRLRWFFGHEAAHFWMGNTVDYDKPSGAWITEGSADLLAIRALGTLAPGYDMRRELQREVDDCLAINGAKPLAGASERGETRANYACGALLMLAAEGAERQHDPAADAATFARRLLDANRLDRVVTQADWLATFQTVSGNPQLARRAGEWLDNGASDPAAFLADLFTATGVAFTRVGDRLTLV